MGRSRRIWMLFPILFGLEGVLAGQAMVEHALGAGRAATSTAPASGVKKAASGIADSLERLTKGQDVSSSGSGSVVRVVEPATGKATRVESAAAVGPVKVYEDPAAIQTGMASDELVRRFGPPAAEVTGASNGRLLTYSGKNGVVQLEVRDQKVERVMSMTPHQGAVILPVGQTVRP